MELKLGFKLTEAGVIPEDWEITTVGSEFSIQLGKMLDIEKNIGVPRPYLGNRAVQWGRIVLDDIGSIKMTPSDMKKYRLRPGDLLVCEGGEIGRAAIWTEPIDECYYQKALHRLRPTRGYNVRLMLSMLGRWASTGFLLKFVTQTSIAHLSKDKFETVPLPLPPTKAEQQAIAEALSDADVLMESLEQLIAKKRQLKQGAMQELLTGKRRLPGFDGEWAGAKMSDYFTPVTTRNEELNDNVVTISAQQGFVRQEDFFKKRVASKVLGNYYLLNRGHFAYNRSYSNGYPYGAIKCLNKYGKAVVTTLYICFRIKSDTTTYVSFFEQYFEAGLLNAGLATVVNEGGRAHGLLNVTRGDFFSRPIKVPPFAEQAAIAAVLADMDAEIATQETKLVKARQLKQGMSHNLLSGRIRLV